MRQFILCYLVLVLGACDVADREVTPRSREAESTAASSAGARDAIDARPDSAQADTLDAVEYFAFRTEEHELDLLSPWREADPMGYSGSYVGEYGDTGFNVVMEVRSAEGGNGYQVSGVVESTTAGMGRPERTPFGPTPLQMEGDMTLFAISRDKAAFMIFSRGNGQAPLQGLLFQGLFYEKSEPES
jgi:hypothetical protein